MSSLCKKKKSICINKRQHAGSCIKKAERKEIHEQLAVRLEEKVAALMMGVTL
jgi:hypothetical protein